jgi:GAF domain-containing protein
MDSHTLRPKTPAVRVDALEMFVELLSRVEADGSSDAFYSSLCEATCRLAGMDRAVIFRYDDARRRVRAAGAWGIAPELFADAQVTLESAPVARRALVEDQVIEVRDDMADEVPEEYRHLVAETALVCTPLAAAGRWFGVIMSDRGRGRPPLSDAERYLLWTLGKTAALASFARLATNQQARARQLQERIDLAREVHESVIQRLFGVQLVFSSQTELSPEARERIGAELQAALVDLRRALQRPLGRSAPETQTTLLQEVERLRREHPDLTFEVTAVGAGRGGPQRPQARHAHARGGDARARRRRAHARRGQRRRARPAAADGHGPATGGAGGAAGGRDRRVRRARARHLAGAAGGAA